MQKFADYEHMKFNHTWIFSPFSRWDLKVSPMLINVKKKRPKSSNENNNINKNPKFNRSWANKEILILLLL